LCLSTGASIINIKKKKELKMHFLNITSRNTMKRIKKSKQNNDERLEFLSLRMIEADSLRQINFKDLIKDVANKNRCSVWIFLYVSFERMAFNFTVCEKYTQCSLLQLTFSV
jgi:hypothetical protein